MGFDPGFKHPMCLATLKSSELTKQSVCGWQYIYIYIYIYRERERERERGGGFKFLQNVHWFIKIKSKRVETIANSKYSE